MEKALPLELRNISEIYLESQETKTYMIPVYQRNYAWEEDEITALIKDVHDSFLKDSKASYYIGTLVTYKRNDNEYEVIDGQQRLTTITLLLLAMRNLTDKGLISSDEGNLGEQINQRFLVSPWAKEDDKIKLRPVKSDREAFLKLFGEEEDYCRAVQGQRGSCLPKKPPKHLKTKHS